MAKQKKNTKSKEVELQEMFSACSDLLSTAAEDLAKFINGTNAAGGRLRKGLQEIKKLAKPLRDLVTDIKKERKEAKLK